MLQILINWWNKNGDRLKLDRRHLKAKGERALVIVKL